MECGLFGGRIFLPFFVCNLLFFILSFTVFGVRHPQRRRQDMYRRLFGFILFGGLVAFSAGTAASDEYHYTNLIIGDRASGMGGAYTAVADDATGLYYNPAGVAYSAGRNISASVNAYYNTEKTYKSVIGGNGWIRTSSSLLPNYFGVVQPVGKFRIGISYAVPESIMENQDQTFNNLALSNQVANPNVDIKSYIINFNNESNTYNFGPSIAMELNSKLSAGLTLYYYQKRTMFILNQILKTDRIDPTISAGGPGYEWSNVKRLSTEWGFRPVLGFMLTPVDNVSVGLALSKVFIEGSNTMWQVSQRAQNISPGEVDYINLPDGQTTTNQTSKYPTQISLGVAWFPTQSLLLTADVNYVTKVNEQDVVVNNAMYGLRPEAKAVTNIALGGEYYVSKSLAMRAGLYTNYANTPQIVSGVKDQNEHIDMYGGTLSLSHFTRNTSVTLGGGYTYGAGKTQIIGDSLKIQDAESKGWMFFLSSSYSY